MYDEYGEAIMDDDAYYYSAYGPEVILHIFITSSLKIILMQIILYHEKWQSKRQLYSCGSLLLTLFHVHYLLY